MGIDINITEKLFPNVTTVIIQLCSTGVLFYFARKFLWQPAREFLEKKAELTQQPLTDALNAKADAETMRSDANKQLQQASIKAQEVVENSKLEGKRIKDSLISDARNQADQILKNSREEISYEQARMREDIQKEIIDVALLAAEKLIQEKADIEDNRSSIEKFVKEITEDE